MDGKYISQVAKYVGLVPHRTGNTTKSMKMGANVGPTSHTQPTSSTLSTVSSTSISRAVILPKQQLIVPSFAAI